MSMACSRTCRSGDGEALHLPPDVAFGEDVELVLVRSGDVLTVYPATVATMRAVVAQFRALPAPPTIEGRDDDVLPEPPGIT